MSKGWQKSIRLINFGDEYSQENIIQRLPENQGKVILQPFQKAEYKPEVNKEDKPKAGGLYGLYLYYYKLRTLPKNQKPNPNKVHYLLRGDLLKLDEITAQVRFLEKHNIVTSE